MSGGGGQWRYLVDGVLFNQYNRQVKIKVLNPGSERVHRGAVEIQGRVEK